MEYTKEEKEWLKRVAKGSGEKIAHVERVKDSSQEEMNRALSKLQEMMKE